MRGARAGGRERARASSRGTHSLLHGILLPRALAPSRLCALLGAAALLACDPGTRRPDLVPLPQAVPVEVRYRRDAATQRLVRMLREDSIPLSLVARKDGYVESPWLDAATLAPANRTPIGPGIVRIRGWVDPARVGFSFVTVEVVYRAVLDPSLPERELERAVAEDHPVRKRIDAVMEKVKVYERGAVSGEQ